MLKIVRSGSWLYDNSARSPVDIVALDYDFWYEIGKADDQLESGEEPCPLGDGGHLYYVRFRNAGSVAEPTWVDSQSHLTVKEAIATAQERSPTPIEWS